MKNIIKSLIRFLEEDEMNPVLESAVKQFGYEYLRVFSGEILSWLRSDLFIPRRKAIRYPNRPQWFGDFTSFVQSTDDLNELLTCANYSIGFRDEVSFDERMEIHRYVVENYKPHLFRTYH